jgi:hypothetical protein
MTAEAKAPIGYDDTPIIPGTHWHVHDGARPQPALVTPGTSSTEAAPGAAPSDAIVLFGGDDVSAWVGRDGDVQWKVSGGVLEVTRSGDIQTKAEFGDCQLHLEWAAPTEVKGDSQGRGNSGVFLMDLYEIQVLDGYDNVTYADGITASIYGQFPPAVNACRPPGEWQTYDMVFTAPRFDDHGLASPAYITILHNGIVVQNHQEILGPTGHRTLSSYDKPHGPTGPLRLQDHGDPVRYRNIWIRRLD